MKLFSKSKWKGRRMISCKVNVKHLSSPKLKNDWIA